ncbi:MAG: MerR family DNA-binding transcriptional regulator [Candidatus Moranbacteria bacterium]|nr:MerR family DNA-binding transcriptional regulator [Candidatus Moranbacteria bacterium]
MNNDFIQIKEASQLLGVSKLTLRNWDKSGKLMSYRHPINNYRIYKRDDIMNLINDMSIPKPLSQKTINNKNKIYKLKVIHLKD